MASPPTIETAAGPTVDLDVARMRAVLALVASALWIAGIGSVVGLVLARSVRRDVGVLAEGSADSGSASGSPRISTTRRIATVATVVGWVGLTVTALVLVAAVAPNLDRFEQVGPATYFVAFAGGVFSFLSPCVLPIVPAYLSVITGLDIATIEEGEQRHTLSIVKTTSMFVLGFGTVFVLLGLTATGIGQALVRNQEILTRVSGAMMLAMALFLLGSLFLQAPWLYQEKRFHPELGRFGTAAPAVAGVAFGFGWTPCIGPVLGSIIGIAAASGRMWAGATLLATYAIGLGVPFLVSGLAFGRLQSTFGWVKEHFTGIVMASALLLAGFGILLLMDNFTVLTSELQRFLDRIGLDWIVELG